MAGRDHPAPRLLGAAGSWLQVENLPVRQCGEPSLLLSPSRVGARRTVLMILVLTDVVLLIGADRCRSFVVYPGWPGLKPELIEDCATSAIVTDQ
jgi:hypothetical protein